MEAMKKYRINVRNWQGNDSVLQITDGQVVLQSLGKVEDIYTTKEEAIRVLASIEKADTYKLTVDEYEEVANV